MAVSAEYWDGKLYFVNSSSGDAQVWVYTAATDSQEPFIDLKTTAGNAKLAVDKDYVYVTTYEDIQDDGTAGASYLAVYTHDGVPVKEIPLDSIKNDAMKTIMCTNDAMIFLGNSNGIFDQTLYVIEKDGLKKTDAAKPVPLLAP